MSSLSAANNHQQVAAYNGSAYVCGNTGNKRNLAKKKAACDIMYQRKPTMWPPRSHQHRYVAM